MPSVTFESVNDDFNWGSYGDFKVLIMADNGYINATKLCSDGEKEFTNWMLNAASKDLILELQSSLGIPRELVIVKNMRGSYETRGTYVHLDLIPHIACWVSPRFALKVSRIVNGYLLKEERDKHLRVVEDKNIKIEELKGMISHLSEKQDSALQSLTAQMAKINLDNKITHDALNDVLLDLDDANSKLDISEDALDEANQNIKLTLKKLDKAVDDRVVTAVDDSKLHTFVIMKYDDPKTGFMYHAIRRQKASVTETIKKIIKQNPNAIELVNIDYNPNATVMFNVVKRKLKDNIITNRNDFNIVDLTEVEFIERVHQINESRRDTETL